MPFLTLGRLRVPANVTVPNAAVLGTAAAARERARGKIRDLFRNLEETEEEGTGREEERGWGTGEEDKTEASRRGEERLLASTVKGQGVGGGGFVSYSGESR